MTVDAFQFSFQTNLHNDKPLLLTGSRCSSASLLGVRGFTGTSSLHSLSDALGDSARSRNSSRFGPLNLILSNRLSMFNTEICVFILTWREAALQGQRQQIEKLCNCITYKAKSIETKETRHDMLIQFMFFVKGMSSKMKQVGT